MLTIDTAGIQPTQLDDLASFVDGDHRDPQLRRLVHAVIALARDGHEVNLFAEGDTLTPRQAAEALGMSRTHLYKILDRGELPFHRVGRDRRIRVADLKRFQELREREALRLAEDFAHEAETRAQLAEEIAELL